MLNPVVANEVARERRQDMVRHAEAARQARQAKAEGQDAKEGLGRKLGSLFGSSKKKRAESGVSVGQAQSAEV